eukprot:TRINITY_DN72265_c0_g1_i1.p1 TRINITY_DN72265_c0_g1~~TRINITY_DN72265_c0_g1_i1.p1  ORF type:complete len:361 (-),score=27.85 TRINITY_DN72265_c0_g1_i1:190-1272(-)
MSFTHVWRRAAGAGVKASVVGAVSLSVHQFWTQPEGLRRQNAQCTRFSSCVLAESASYRSPSESFLSRSFIADAAASVAPAVVNIQVKGLLSGVTGSGFLIDETGLIITNAHVVKGAPKGAVVVSLWDGRELGGHVHSMDILSDIALVKVDEVPKGGVPVAKIGISSRLRPGDFVVALGSPLNLGRTVTAGIVSSTARHAAEIGMLSSKLDYLQTDAAINQGNSGGPLVNLDGEVVGVCTLKVRNTDGIAFAIPMDSAWPVVKQLLRHKKVPRPYIGVKLRTDHRLEAVFVDAVKPDSPGDKAGLRVGDRFVTIDGHPVNRMRDVLNRTGVSPGQQIHLVIESPGGDRREVTLVTAPLPS